MQFAATLIQWTYRRHLRWVAALELNAAAKIERVFIKYLRTWKGGVKWWHRWCHMVDGGWFHGATGRRNTRSYWLGVDLHRVSRDTIQWVLRAAGKLWEGKRDELEQRMHEYAVQ